MQMKNRNLKFEKEFNFFLYELCKKNNDKTSVFEYKKWCLIDYAMSFIQEVVIEVESVEQSTIGVHRK